MKRIWEKWGNTDSETRIFLLFLFGMAIYYGWRLAALTPWYDELYTYYYFVSRGPAYAAIHWPLPNNHVGYSVLSAILDLFGNAKIGLRGISWISSLISLCILFKLGRKCFSKGLALVLVFIFASMDIVNALAVQGRGYALASCLYLAALYELMRIIMFNTGRKRDYVIIACSFIWSLYTLPSSVYFVVPLCVIGGGWLLMNRRMKEFVRFFITACISAACTVLLYTLIWLAIGSNLLSKAGDSAYYGQGHVSIILHAPLSAISTGVKYMLDTPYIQSVEREGYIFKFGTWIKALLENYYSGLSIPLAVIICIGITAIIFTLYRHISKHTRQGFLEWYILLSFLLTPLMLIIQAALPYYRVFSFFGIPLAMLIVWLLDILVSFGRKPVLAYAVSLFAGLLCIRFLMLPEYHAQYSYREAAIEDALTHMDLKDSDILCVTDCDQEYLAKYLLGDINIAYVIEEADYILLDNKLILPENVVPALDSYSDFWKLYLSYDEIPREYIENETEVCYENDRFVMYRKKER